ncbi:MAG: translesion DNA synthesis-associated protein ImuA [Gammaproteobacteria bacterium]
MPAAVRAALWRADALGSPVTSVVASGWAELDRELPGGGWPCHALTEVLGAQPSVLEWRLFGPALRTVVASGKTVVVVGPPKAPHLPGLAHCGINERHLVWIAAATPAERLWCTEQLVKSNATGALLAWLPQARPEQIRRLQVCSQACEGLVVLFRPRHFAGEASAAPLRVQAGLGPGWELHVQVLKRRGGLLDATLVLPSVPGGLQAVLTPRVSRPGAHLHSRELAADAVGGNVVTLHDRRLAGVH